MCSGRPRRTGPEDCTPTFVRHGPKPPQPSTELVRWLRGEACEPASGVEWRWGKCFAAAEEGGAEVLAGPARWAGLTWLTAAGGDPGPSARLGKAMVGETSKKKRGRGAFTL